jgi:hypothetical protein
VVSRRATDKREFVIQRSATLIRERHIGDRAVAAKRRVDDPGHLGARIGATAVLHTWGSAMTHHSHVHVIVPGGGISLDGTRWVGSKPGFLLPVQALSRLFRRLLLAALADARAAGRLAFFGEIEGLCRREAFAARLVRLRQATLRRATSRSRLSRPLHPSRRHLEQSPRRARRAPCDLPLQGLPPAPGKRGTEQ